MANPSDVKFIPLTPLGEVVNVPATGSFYFPRGAFAAISVNNYCVTASCNSVSQSIGVIDTAVDNTAGAAGDLQVPVRVNRNIKWPSSNVNAAVTRQAIGQQLYIATGSSTFTATPILTISGASAGATPDKFSVVGRLMDIDFQDSGLIVELNSVGRLSLDANGVVTVK